MATSPRSGVPLEAAHASRGALVVAASLPFLFAHVKYQPGVSLPGGVDVETSDLAVGAVVVAALLAPRVRIAAVLRAGRVLFGAPAALLAWIAVCIALPVAADRQYDLGEHLVTAAGFAEYALLAVAVPILLRTRTDLVLVLGALAAWTCVTAGVAAVQFLGVDILEASPLGHRQPSIVGYHDFAALTGGTAAVGVAGIALGPRALPHLLSVVAAAAGLLGLALSGSVAGGVGMAAATALVLLVGARRGLTRRRAAAIVAALAAAGLTTVAVRGGDIDQFARFLGAGSEEPAASEHVQTYSQRTLLAYFGLRVFLDHPVAGAGWQATTEYPTLAPYLDNARERFPTLAAEAFPSPEHPYGVQNGWIQSLSDLGAVGFVLFSLALLVPVAIGTRRALRAPPVLALPALAGSATLLVAAGVWTAQGLVAAAPLDAITWLAVALVVHASLDD